jgi:hypothetical protein
MNVKELFENEELMKNIVEDIDYIPEDTEVFYAVWALVYTCGEERLDAEILVGEFDNPDEAVACAKKVSFETLREAGYEEPDEDTVYFSVEVETVIGDPDDEDGCTMNIGTIYQRELWIDGEYGSEDDAPCSVASVVAITPNDYFILDDGLFRVRTDFLQEYKVGDVVSFYFIDEPDSDMLTYKLLSVTAYDGDEYFDCELLI